MKNQSKSQICIIEDEVDIASTMKEFLEAKGYEASTFHSAEEFFAGIDPDFEGLYLVDWNLPGESGVEIIKKIRLNDYYSPVFMVSAYSKKEEIIEGLNAGADDYITKPFSLEELEARVCNASQKFLRLKTEISTEEIKLLPEAKSFIKDGQTVSLTKREYLIFECLYNNASEPVNRESMLNSFDPEEGMTVRNIDVHIFSLRKKIKLTNLFIETMWGKGYKLVVS